MSKKQFDYNKGFDLGKWVVTDELQVVKKVAFDGNNFEFISIETFELDNEIIIKKQNIDFNIFDEDIETHVMLYGYDGVEDVISIYEDQAPSIIAEIISELNVLTSGEVIGKITPDTKDVVSEFNKIVNNFIIKNNL